MVYEDLPVAEFAFRGPLRDQLVAAILAGGKTTTTGLAVEHQPGGEPVPRPGQRYAVIDSAGYRVAVIETIAVRELRLGDVDLAHALGRARDIPRSRSSGPRTNGSGTRRRCVRRSATRGSPSATTRSWLLRSSGWWRAGTR